MVGLTYMRQGIMVRLSRPHLSQGTSFRLILRGLLGISKVFML